MLRRPVCAVPTSAKGIVQVKSTTQFWTARAASTAAALKPKNVPLAAATVQRQGAEEWKAEQTRHAAAYAQDVYGLSDANGTSTGSGRQVFAVSGGSGSMQFWVLPLLGTAVLWLYSHDFFAFCSNRVTGEADLSVVARRRETETKPMGK